MLLVCDAGWSCVPCCDDLYGVAGGMTASWVDGFGEGTGMVPRHTRASQACTHPRDA